MNSISVIIPTHNPHPERLGRALEGLQKQTLNREKWSVVIVDNASHPAVNANAFPRLDNLRIVCESTLGLTAARRRGFLETQSPLLIMVDDDNVLMPDYLENVLLHFTEHDRIGAMGGRCLPEFEKQPELWIREFDDLLALRDPGDAEKFCYSLCDEKTGRAAYPECAPVGAGMALRREAIQTWLDDVDAEGLSDRKGNQLTSAGDNDLIVHILKSGWGVAYFPDLCLTHLISKGRTTVDYLARLNCGIQDSWMRLLARHSMNPWPPVAAWSVPLRKMKAWFTFGAWKSPAHYVRWRGVCGHFSGRVS